MVKNDRRKYGVIAVSLIAVMALIVSYIYIDYYHNPVIPHKPDYRIDLSLWQKDPGSDHFANMTVDFECQLNVSFYYSEINLSIDYGDGKGYPLHVSVGSPVLESHLYLHPGNFDVNITGYIIPVHKGRLNASSNTSVVVLPLVSPSITISSRTLSFHLNESILLNYSLHNNEMKALKMAELCISVSSLDYWIQTPSGLTIHEIGQRYRRSPTRIELSANQVLNGSTILNDDLLVFGNGSYRSDFTEIGKYSVYAGYYCVLAGSDIWTGTCISNLIYFYVVE